MEFINEYNNQSFFKDEEELRKHFISKSVKTKKVKKVFRNIGITIFQFIWLAEKNTATDEDLFYYQNQIKTSVEYILHYCDMNNFITNDKQRIPVTKFIPIEVWINWILDSYNN